jgi:hypothetical protein
MGLTKPHFDVVAYSIPSQGLSEGLYLSALGIAVSANVEVFP